MTVAVLVGSLRRASFTRRLAYGLIALAPGLDCGIVEIGDLALYNQDFDDDNAAPAAWTTFRAAIRAADAVLFVTPEYNRAAPATLKNAIDIGSRPWGQSVWTKKPAAIVSCSPGALGGPLANHSLRPSLMCLDVAVMAGPEAYVGNVAKVLTDDDAIVDTSREFLTTFMTSFADWIARTAPHG